MTKSALRKKYKALREKMSSSQIDDYSLAIANQLLTLSIWDYKFYHLFLSITNKKETNTDFILNILSGKDKNIVISKSDFESGIMHNFLLTDSTKIVLNNYSIPEPVDGIPISNDLIEVVFIPLLAYDKNGQRVGYGKGFYDKFLASCSTKTIKIGLSFFEPEDTIEDINQNDIKLDFCITPKAVYSF